jgi:glycosyltransferase involved in cell wall biosynthesis
VNVSRCYPEKAQGFLLRCFARVRERRPEAKLWILGVGPLQEQLKALCRQLNLDGPVRFLGFVEDLASTLALADVQVHPSHAEGVPQAVLAGMAAGLPVVGSQVGGLPEILGDGRGILVADLNLDVFANAIEELIEDAALRRSLGERARRFVKSDYSLASATRRLEQTYTDLVLNP